MEKSLNSFKTITSPNFINLALTYVGRPIHSCSRLMNYWTKNHNTNKIFHIFLTNFSWCIDIHLHWLKIWLFCYKTLLSQVYKIIKITDFRRLGCDSCEQYFFGRFSFLYVIGGTEHFNKRKLESERLSASDSKLELCLLLNHRK